MKKISELNTPAFLIDVDKLEANIKQTAALCKRTGKSLYPMIKTHKCLEIASMQREHGAQGFLVGTLDEAQMLVDAGYSNIVLAYPVVGAANLDRVITMAQKAKVILSLDGLEAAQEINELLSKQSGLILDYMLIVNCGLNRFGVSADVAVELVQKMRRFKNLNFVGVSTHPGHVYGKQCMEEVGVVAAEEISALKTAKQLIEQAGFSVQYVATGSTPTLEFVAQDDCINILRPGNYVFNDAIQVALGVVTIEQCAFAVLASIVSQPQKDLFIIDAGSKCLGLDKGAHGVALLNGYGIVKDHPELIVEGLSEEVGKIRITGETSLKVGDKIQIIPNHACASVNMTSYIYGIKDNMVHRVFEVDARGNSIKI